MLYKEALLFVTTKELKKIAFIFFNIMVIDTDLIV